LFKKFPDCRSSNEGFFEGQYGKLYKHKATTCMHCMVSFIEFDYKINGGVFTLTVGLSHRIKYNQM